jgi:hypothetical protein
LGVRAVARCGDVVVDQQAFSPLKRPLRYSPHGEHWQSSLPNVELQS